MSHELWSAQVCQQTVSGREKTTISTRLFLAPSLVCRLVSTSTLDKQIYFARVSVIHSTHVDLSCCHQRGGEFVQSPDRTELWH